MASPSVSLKVIKTCFEEDVLSPDQAATRFPSLAVRERLIELGVLKREPDGQRIRITFVGLAVSGGQAYQFMPKVLRGSSPSSTGEVMRHVVRALRHYARWRPSHHEPSPNLQPNPSDPALSALAISDWLIRDYLSSGIYRRTAERYEADGAGQVSWARTIEQVPPFIVQGRPAYLSFITRASVRDVSHFVSRLHRHVIDKASAAFGHLLGFTPVSLDHEPFEPFLETPPAAACQAYLGQEMRMAFSDRAMQLLPMLLAWVTGQAAGSRNDLALYGTASFYRVWEAACGAALGNEIRHWQAKIPVPIWTSATGSIQAAETFIPDIVMPLGPPNTDSSCLLIADAKYYSLRMPPGLGGQPGVNDIAKQLWYEQCLQAAAHERGYSRISNIFVVPGRDGGPSFWEDGHVVLKGIGASRVLITRLAVTDALKRYIETRRLDLPLIKGVVGPSIPS
jgi:hypothetical protein